MSGTAKSVCALLCLAAALTAPAARADIAPPDVTCETKGAACDNAAPNAFGDGVCTTGVPTTAFGRPSCGPEGEAGEAGASPKECLFCKASAGSGGGGSGSAGAGNAGANTAGTSSAGAPTKAGVAGAPATSNDSTDNGDSGCSVHRLGSERGIAIFMLGLGLTALTLGRRRR